MMFLIFSLISCNNIGEGIEELKDYPNPKKYQEDYNAYAKYCRKMDSSKEKCNNVSFCTYSSTDCPSGCINSCLVNFSTKGLIIKEDTDYIYYMGKKLYNLDKKTFKKIPDYWGLNYAIDNKHIVCNGYKRNEKKKNSYVGDIKIFDSKNTDKFHNIKCTNKKRYYQRKYYFTDSKKLFYGYCIFLDNFDFDTLDPLCEDDERFLKDNKGYIYKGIRISDKEYKILSNGTLGDIKYRNLYEKYEKISNNLIYGEE